MALTTLLPPQLSVLEATMRADLINQCPPERVQSLAIQKSAATVADLLHLTFQTFLPSEPSARIDGLETSKHRFNLCLCRSAGLA